MSLNRSGAAVLWQSSMPIKLSEVKGDNIEPLEEPTLIKVNPSSDLSLEISVLWGDKKKTPVVIKAWETMTSNILISKIFDTGTTVEDLNIKLYK